jgi:Rps23 Pro-64 3,4-dihydroxylase Tpa1-like proline 4-hydroxylase
VIEGYKIIDIGDYLSPNELNEYLNCIKKFNVDLSKIESSLDFLAMGSGVIKHILIEDSARYRRMKENNKIDYDDYLFLNSLNVKYNIPVEEYFNFFLHIANTEYNETVLFNLIKKIYVKFLEQHFNKTVNVEYVNNILGGINVYPKGSSIRKHTDTGVNSNRLLTTLFFLNKNRKYEDGSILKIYTKNEVIEVIPDYQKFVVLEHQHFNYVHEVTRNTSKNTRYTVYNPFSIDDYETKLT